MKQELEIFDDKKKVVFRLSIEDIEKLKIIAAKKHTTQNNCFDDAMQAYLKKNERLWK